MLETSLATFAYERISSAKIRRTVDFDNKRLGVTLSSFVRRKSSRSTNKRSASSPTGSFVVQVVVVVVRFERA